MPSFTARMVLIEANGGDYETLHDEMENEGFSRIITSDKGVSYHLPDAEYSYFGNLTKIQVLNKAKSAASKVKKDYRVLITQSGGRTWHNLEIV